VAVKAARHQSMHLALAKTPNALTLEPMRKIESGKLDIETKTEH